jgi:hypothetical protein
VAQADLSAEDFVHPEKFLQRVPAWLRRLLPESSSERLSRAIAVRGQTLLVLFLLGYAYDWADTEVQKRLLGWGLLTPTPEEAPGAVPISLDEARRAAASKPRPARDTPAA